MVIYNPSGLEEYRIYSKALAKKNNKTENYKTTSQIHVCI